MDRLVEHAIRMLETVEGENDFFRNDAKRQADIARAVYDTILRVQVLERKVSSNCSENPNNSENHSGGITEMVTDDPQTIAEDINRRVKNAYHSCGMAEDEPQMEMSGVLTLTEESSNELFRVLKEHDEAFINDVLDGKCGFTITSTDGRSVELVPTQNKRSQRVQRVEECNKCCIQTEVGCEQTDCPWR